MCPVCAIYTFLHTHGILETPGMHKPKFTQWAKIGPKPNLCTIIAIFEDGDSQKGCLTIYLQFLMAYSSS